MSQYFPKPYRSFGGKVKIEMLKEQCSKQCSK